MQHYSLKKRNPGQKIGRSVWYSTEPWRSLRLSTGATTYASIQLCWFENIAIQLSALAGISFDNATVAMNSISSNQCPEIGQKEMLVQMIAQSSRDLEATEQKLADLQPMEGILKELDSAFGRKGIPSFAFEGVLGELQVEWHSMSTRLE